MDIFDAVLAAQIAKNGDNGSGSVTSVNGKTGAVVLDAGDVGAEPERFVVTVTGINGTYSADKTFAEIEAAHNAKKTITVLLPALNDMELQESSFYSFGNGEGGADFYGIMSPTEIFQPIIIGVFVDSAGQSDTWNYMEFQPQKDSLKRSISDVSPTIIPAANTIYKCGELTSLTISNPPATGAYSIVFTSGKSATTTTIPSTILGLESFAAEANTLYEINVLDNRAVVGSWAVTP